jgi:transcriptional regulator with XRE-family HTH domain
MGNEIERFRRSEMNTALEKLVDYEELLGQVIASRRKEAGLSQKEMADALGLKSQSGYSRIESGSVALSATALRKAAITLGTLPQSIVAEVELLSERLEGQGFRVTNRSEEKNISDIGKKVGWFVGGAALGGLIALLLKGRDD